MERVEERVHRYSEDVLHEDVLEEVVPMLVPSHPIR